MKRNEITKTKVKRSRQLLTIEEKGINIIVKGLVVKEELGDEAEVPTIGLVLVPIKLKE